MNILTHVCQRIKAAIPPQVLSRFMQPMKYGQVRRDPFGVANIDNFIIEKVIYGRVVPDCDILDGGAAEVVIPLMGIQPERIDRDKYILHIPRHLTNGRSIVSALALVLYSVENMGGSINGMMLGAGVNAMGNNGCGNSSNLGPIQALARAYQPMPLTQTTNVRAIDGDTVLVEDILMPTPNSYLRCMLSHDKELSTIARPAWRYFADLCILATKSYIYNNFIIDIDMAELVGGQELGRFKEIIEGYSDAEELYNTYLDEKWRKVQFMSDEARHARHIKQLIGRYK